MSPATDAERARQICNGDIKAYQAVLNEHLPSVAGYVTRMTGDAAEAEDITQEVFLRLWQRCDTYDPGKSRLSTWLHNIAHNLCIDHFRKRSRWVHGELGGDEAVSEDQPDAMLVSHVESEDVKICLAALPESQRSAIILSYYQGLSNRETAEILNISVEALESLLARGRRKLQSLLAQRRET